jgi:hypothetical protein
MDYILLDVAEACSDVRLRFWFLRFRGLQTGIIFGTFAAGSGHIARRFYDKK